MRNAANISIVFYIISFSLLSCSASRNIAGTYRSKFGVFGMFGTTVRLKKDNTLQYVFQGDMIYDSATGNYQICDDKVYVTFDKERQDTNRLYYRFDGMPLKIDTCLGSPISYKLFLYIGHNKLFPAHVETGKKVTRASGYSKRKKYLLFGSHYYTRRYYYELRQ
jgi:hypothetical protein